MGDESLRPRLCTIRKWSDFPGYGFNLHAERGRAGQYIGKVDDDSPAQAAGMKEGDRIVEVEGVNIGNENHAQVVTRIKAAGEFVTMLLVDTETDNFFKSQKVVVASDMSEVLRLETPPRPGTEEDKESAKNTRMEAQVDNDKRENEVESAEVESAIRDSAEVKKADADAIPDSESVTADNEAKSDEEDHNDRKPNDDTARVDSEKEADEEQAVDDVDNDNKSEQSNEDVPASVPSTVVIEPPEEKQNEEANVVTEASVTDSVGSGTDNADDDLPPPEPESEPPADDPPSYEAQADEQAEEDTPAEPEDEPEVDRPPSPDAIPVVTSHAYHPRLCIIRKWPDFQGYGFNLHAEKEKKGQYIGLVDANSPAEDADLRKGDRIIEVNGSNIEDDTHQQVIQKIKAGGDVTKMLVVDNEADDYFKNNGIQVTADMPEVITNETRQKESSAMTFIPRQCHVIKRPDFSGYGFNLHAEKERGGQYIGQIDDNSPAQEAGLREHDRIIEVNGVNIENETHQQVIARIKSGGDETKLLVVDREADNYFKSRGTTVTSSMPEVKFTQSTRPSPRTSAVTNGDSSPTPASQPTRVEPVKNSEPAQANGGDFMSMNLSAKEMRERLARKKKNDPKQKSNMDFKSKFEIFQKM